MERERERERRGGQDVAERREGERARLDFLSRAAEGAGRAALGGGGGGDERAWNMEPWTEADSARVAVGVWWRCEYEACGGQRSVWGVRGSRAVTKCRGVWSERGHCCVRVRLWGRGQCVCGT